MKIGIDTFGCDHARSGLGSYLLYFITNIPVVKDIEIVLFGSEIDRYTYSSDTGYEYISVSVPDSLEAERLWHRFSFKKFIKKNQFDAVLFPAAERVIPTSFKNYQGLAVVNSIISSNLSQTPRTYRHQLKKGLSKVQTIIAASDFIKKDLIALGIKASKIQVIHNGIDHKLFYPMLDLDQDIINIKPFAIKRPYFIYGSRLSGPEKKHEQLIKAFNQFKKNTGLPHRLVIAGDDGLNSEAVQTCAFQSDYSSDIFLTGYFPHESFPKLYAGAEACIFPSVNEGVGLPILEAMACGIPVLCSNEGALPEIGGNSPLYFDSDNIDEISGKMQEIIENQAKRTEMITKGLEWSKNYSWNSTVIKTLSLISDKYKDL